MPGTDANWKAFKAMIATPDLPGLGPKPRDSRRRIPELNRLVDRFLAEAELTQNLNAPLRSAALFWHDHLDASHEISQALHTRDGSFLHGIMHRREPDYGNAKYWFHRAGEHPAYPGIADQIARLLCTRQDRDLLNRITPKGNWDPCGFVDACEQAAQKPGAKIASLQAVQEIEFDALLTHLFGVPSQP